MGRVVMGEAKTNGRGQNGSLNARDLQPSALQVIVDNKPWDEGYATTLAKLALARKEQLDVSTPLLDNDPREIWDVVEVARTYVTKVVALVDALQAQGHPYPWGQLHPGTVGVCAFVLRHDPEAGIAFSKTAEGLLIAHPNWVDTLDQAIRAWINDPSEVLPDNWCSL